MSWFTSVVINWFRNRAGLGTLWDDSQATWNDPIATWNDRPASWYTKNSGGWYE